MSDFTNELLRLSEMREKGLISQEEFEAAKAKLFGNSESPAQSDQAAEAPVVSEAATVVMTAIPSEQTPEIPAATAASPVASKEVPPGIAGWSWGAFLWSWIWAIFNNTWIGLLALIPGVNLVMIFVLGAKGREWAWKNKHWDSVEHFNRVQRKWSLWGIWLVLGSLILAILLTVGSLLFFKSQITGAMDANGLSTMQTSDEVYAPVEPAVVAPAEETATETATAAPDAVTDESSTTSADDAAPVATQDATVDEPVQEDQAAQQTAQEDQTTAQDDAAAEQARKHQQELAKTRAEAAAAKAEAAKAKKEALKAEKALADQKRREREEQERIAREEAEQEQVQCQYSKAQPLTCSSRKGQPAYCDWNFRACGNPRIAKKESKTTCEGKVEWDPDNSHLIVTEGCRAQFVPTR